MLVLKKKIIIIETSFPTFICSWKKNLNPFLLNRKLADKTKHQMIYMLWKESMPIKFYRHIYKEKNLFIFD